MRYSEAEGKARETGGSRITIGEILCLFLLRKLPILLAPISFSLLYVGVTQKMRKHVKRDAKSGIVRHDNKSDLGIPNPFLFQVGTH